MSGEPVMLICTRLADMTRMHPDQIEKICFECGHVVGVYPTGQQALERWPSVKIICTPCANPSPNDKIYSAGSLDEVVQEIAESKTVTRQ
jgi:hypothetical protein